MKFIAFLFTLIFTVVTIVPKVMAANALPIRIKYLTSNVTTSAFTQLVSSTVRGLKGISVFNSGKNPIELAFGSMGAEVVQVVHPGSAGNIAPAPLFLPLTAGYGTRISVITLDDTNSTGELEVNLFYN